MFTGLRPYDEYRKIGLPWLGAVPAHWSVKRAKNIVRPVDVRSTEGHEELLTVSSARGVVPRSSATVSMFQATSYVGHKLCWPGDLVINSLWAWGRGLGVSRFHGIVSAAYGVYRPHGGQPIEANYLDLLSRSDAFQWELQVRSRGVWKSRLQLTDDQFLGAPLTVPPVAEQAAIVKYLAHAHARIDRAIAAKRKLIALLEEQKQAIINQAVTRGLDSTAALVDTGIPWLGKVPAHWTVLMLGRCLTRIEQGWSPTAAEGDLLPDQWAVLSLSAVDRGTFRPTALKPIALDASVPANLEVRLGDLLMTRSNTRSRVGDVAVVESVRPRTILSDLIYRLSTDSTRTDARFLALVLRSTPGRQQIEAAARGSSDTMPKISQGHIRGWRIPLPSLDEQRAIVGNVDHETASCNAAIDRARREIDLLREFRTRLTSDVVTGQVDVRHIAASLPELSPDDLAGDVGGTDDDLADEAAVFLEDVDA
ncbi:MAG: restriction endonuclease subunit S [Cellulomonadaceae bacterium]|nr:restriction endonuclease subunit S [Cellulomonadaceae bacterium]